MLLLRFKRYQHRWFGHVSKIPQERFPKQILHPIVNGKRPVEQPRTRWFDYIKGHGWNRLGINDVKFKQIAVCVGGSKIVVVLSGTAASRKPQGKVGEEKRRRRYCTSYN